MLEDRTKWVLTLALQVIDIMFNLRLLAGHYWGVSTIYAGISRNIHVTFCILINACAIYALWHMCLKTRSSKYYGDKNK